MTQVDEWAPLVLANLKHKFGDDETIRLCELLKETGALIAGGFVLQSVTGQGLDSADIDIYVPLKNIPRFLDKLLAKKKPICLPTHYNSFGASFYCNSFLRKNGIRKIYNFKHVEEQHRRHRGMVIFELDIMSVRNKRTPLEVVNNFDLTFCQVWFDGTTVHASHPDDIRQKKGIVQGDYNILLLNGNKYLNKRLHKYVERGFQITMDPKVIDVVTPKAIVDYNFFNPDKECTNPVETGNKYKDPTFLERWFNRIAMRWFLNVRDNYNKPIYKTGLSVPLAQEGYKNQFQKLEKISKHENGDHYQQKMDSYEVNPDDGYDSDDMNEENLKTIAVENYQGIYDIFPSTEFSPVPVSSEMLYSRGLTNLWINTMSFDENTPYNLGELININRDSRPNLEILANFLQKKCLRIAIDYFGIEGMVYDLHRHSMGGCITQKSLEKYFLQTPKGKTVPCYYSKDGHACEAVFKRSDIKKLVSEPFWQTYYGDKFFNASVNDDEDETDMMANLAPGPGLDMADLAPGPGLDMANLAVAQAPVPAPAPAQAPAPAPAQAPAPVAEEHINIRMIRYNEAMLAGGFINNLEQADLIETLLNIARANNNDEININLLNATALSYIYTDEHVYQLAAKELLRRAVIIGGAQIIDSINPDVDDAQINKKNELRTYLLAQVPAAAVGGKRNTFKRRKNKRGTRRH